MPLTLEHPKVYDEEVARCTVDLVSHVSLKRIAKKELFEPRRVA